MSDILVIISDLQSLQNTILAFLWLNKAGQIIDFLSCLALYDTPTKPLQVHVTMSLRV